MASQTVAATGVLISIEYDATGLEWARIYDNPILAWIIDDALEPNSPLPMVIGQLPLRAPDTTPVISPRWATLENARAVLVPDLWRDNLSDFLTWLATNAGAPPARKTDVRGRGPASPRSARGADACSITI